MTVDGLMAWMAGHRVPDTRCSRCGATQIAYFRDHLERPVGMCCLMAARTAAEVDKAAVNRRLRSIHDCPADGCRSCTEAGL